jgi:hypothetical protein
VESAEQSRFFFLRFSSSPALTTCAAIFYSPPNITDDDYPSIEDNSAFNVVRPAVGSVLLYVSNIIYSKVLTTANSVFSGVSIIVYLRIVSISPSSVSATGDSISITGCCIYPRHKI